VTASSGGIFHHILRTDSLDDPAVVELLLEHGADPMIADEDGDPALVFAASSALVNSATVLLEKNLASSAPFVIAFALKCIHLNHNKGPEDAEAMRHLLLLWHGSKARLKRAMMARKLGVRLDETDYTYPPKHWDQFDYSTMRQMALGEIGFDGKPIVRR